MKRLWVLVSITILLGVFIAPRASAQGIDRVIENGALPAQGTYSYFEGTISSLHSSYLQSLDEILARGGSSTTTGTSTTGSTAQQKAAEDFKKAGQTNYDAYLATFNAEKAKGTPPVDAQIKGIQAWVTSMGENPSRSLVGAYNASSPYSSAYRQYATTVQGAATAAEQIKRGIIAAGSNEAGVQTGSSTITNAARGNTNSTSVVRDTSPSACSLYNGNLVGCIDLIVAWIIKNTLLQIAGFLVWLTANMLNFAIQVSVLDFSKWAPDTLYPVWIVIRQIVSLAVVFAGLWLGFMYIVGDETKFGRYVGWLVLFALFVNFSYPFSRMLVDVSNIVSLNVYTVAVGPNALTANFSSAATTLGADTAGAIIMNKLGLMGLVGSATGVKNAQTASVVDKIDSTPGALIVLAFVLYAAYIFFMATAIIAMRTAVLVFLIVASPLLFVDSVIPKLGDAAAKMRKMFFEQLVVAPVFMIMLALTLKFMDIFQSGNGSLSALQSSGSGAGAIQMFFSVLMMLIMLHIMIKVTKSIAGQAGEYATSAMGKVGGFGLGVATGGAGILARGSIGAAAARIRDSEALDKWKGTRTGRSIFALTNSLAQSSYDVRNVGMVNKKMASLGMGMGAGIKNYDQNYKEKEDATRKFAAGIKDTNARKQYLDQKENSISSAAQKTFLRATMLKEDDRRSDAKKINDRIKEDRKKVYDVYERITDPAKKMQYYQDHKADVDIYEGDHSIPKTGGLLSGTPKGVAPAPDTAVDSSASVNTATHEAPAPVATAPADTDSIATPPSEVPGFLKTAEDKIREREARIESESPGFIKKPAAASSADTQASGITKEAVQTTNFLDKVKGAKKQAPAEAAATV